MTKPQWRLMSDAERSQAYSPSSVLPGRDIEPFIREYIDRSSAAYAIFPDTQTISYGNKASNTIDIVVPKSDKPVPLLVFLHGGYWQELSKLEAFFPAIDTLPRGIAYAAIDYTLAPDATLDEIVNECCSAYLMLRNSAHDLNIDIDRLVISGSSAGAHLAAMCCLKLPVINLPKAVILLSGIYELEPLLNTYINDAIGMNIDTAIRNSPALANLRNFPTSIISWGQNETDEFRRQSRYFANLLISAGRQVDVMEINQRNHFDIVEDLMNNSNLGRKTAMLLDT